MLITVLGARETMVNKMWSLPSFCVNCTLVQLLSNSIGIYSKYEVGLYFTTKVSIPIFGSLPRKTCHLEKKNHLFLFTRFEKKENNFKNFKNHFSDTSNNTIFPINPLGEVGEYVCIQTSRSEWLTIPIEQEKNFSSNQKAIELLNKRSARRGGSRL